MSFTTQSHRLFTRQQIFDAQEAWDRGHFSDEWKSWRHMAAMQAGIIAPPAGDEYDSWDEEKPSERAQIIRAIRETPKALAASIRAPKVHSWAAVIAQLVRRREGINADLDSVKKRAPDTGAAYRLREILQIVGNS